MVMFGYAIWRYRAKPGDESDGEPIHGNTRLEIAWTVIPTVIVLFGAGYSWVDPRRHRGRGAGGRPDGGQRHRPAVRVDASSTPSRASTSNELHVPVGTQLELQLTALDVLHSFWVPEWRIKRDLVPAGPGGDEVDDTVR